LSGPPIPLFFPPPEYRGVPGEGREGVQLRTLEFLKTELTCPANATTVEDCLPSHERCEEYDRIRSEALLSKGIRIDRFSDIDILKHPDAVQATIYRELFDQTPSLPSPGLPGEEENADLPQ